MLSSADLFESVGVINESDGNLTSPDDMEAVRAVSASDNFLAVLGVSPILGRIVSRVMRQGSVRIAAGLLAGLVGSRLLTGYVGSLLFKVTETDLVTFVSVALGLTTVALIATAIPAREPDRSDARAEGGVG